MTPIISIIIPVYNVQNYISVTLNSLLTQSADIKFEIIIINDGSTDNTLNVIVDTLLGCCFDNYKLINKENGGVSSARNTGLLEATGKYILFLDGDDYVSSDLMKEVYNYIGNEEWDMVCWGYDQVNEDHTVLIDYFDRNDNSLSAMNGVEALRNIICNRTMKIWTGSAVYKKEFLSKNGLKFTEGCYSGEDQEFIYKAVSKADKLLFVNETLSYYVQRGDSVSYSCNIRRFDAIAAMERVYEYINDASNKDLQKIAVTFKTKNIIENYLYNLKSYLNNSDKRGTGNILREIDENYPNLNKGMIEIMKSYDGNDRNLKAKIKLFLISPKLYLMMVNLAYRYEGMLNR